MHCQSRESEVTGSVDQEEQKGEFEGGGVKERINPPALTTHPKAIVGTTIASKLRTCFLR